YHAHAADELGVRRGAGSYWHIVLHFGNPVGMEETGDQDVGIRPVVLLRAQYATCGRSDPEPPAFLGIEDRPEHTGRIEPRQTEPIDRTVEANQGSTEHVADDAVMLYRPIARLHHSVLPTSIPFQQRQWRSSRYFIAGRVATISKRLPVGAAGLLRANAEVLGIHSE